MIWQRLNGFALGANIIEFNGKLYGQVTTASGNLVVSEDGGLTWRVIYTIPASGSLSTGITSLQTIGENLVIGTAAGQFYSADGETWTKIATNVGGVIIKAGDRLFAGSSKLPVQLFTLPQTELHGR